MDRAHAHGAAPGAAVATAPPPGAGLPDCEPLAAHPDTTRGRAARSVARHGFAPLPGAIAPAMLAALQDEADARLTDAVFAEQTAQQTAQQTEDLAYRAHMTGLGPVAGAFLRDDRVRGLLTGLFGGDYVLSEHISCLTRYGPADHLGAHQDSPAEDCAVTIILYLRADSPDPAAPDTGLVLNVYGETRESVARGARLRIPTRPGTLVLGRGSRIWHARPPLKAGESVVAITGCYREAAA
ncbi:2OG-Fe(II) oxygenase [Roseospira navarrensis]|uniref:Fe2OG dioxygenase domain-containing protein n=1 Tax=Roseospira navarrensis TaxID=140058 RepID=A0A7X1ZGF4_9PROT|nr:2OG-Fe(II) oxygenase [Roseospira navarrensis]MQX38098.1 hypothetical protein [Roseospira navarrensis]